MSQSLPSRQVRRDVIAVQARAGQAVTAMAQGIGQEIGMVPVTPVTVAALPPLKVKVTAAPPVLPKVDMASAAPAPVQAAAVQPEQPLVAAAVAQEPAPVLKDANVVLDPRGGGDPDAITCRAPQALPSSRLPGPQVCKTNSAWAQLRADGKDVGPDGTIIAARNRPMMTGACSKSALLGAFQTQNLPDGSVLSGCR